ncbi:MAG: metal ABC transporter permease [Candidatus Delongbacteria bacterium]|jgi:zinc transport system permease protein|nr:metal ABC transporter permease [Candidatus Delongbacteria bacterium]
MFEIFTYSFFINAMVTALLASITCGIVGSYIVTKRIVFISGGITHASFGGIGLGYFLGINPIITASIFGVLSAVGIKAVAAKTEVREDSTIGIFWALGMAVGIIFIYMTPGYAPDLMTYLFGNILTISQADMIYLSILTVGVVIYFFIMFKEILFISFDENFARTQNVKVDLINYTLIAIVALSIVVNIRIVGIILVISMLTIPQATAGMLTKNFKQMIFLSIVFGFVSSIGGLIISYDLNIPSGASIIFSSVILFIIVKTIKAVSSLKKN